MGREGGRRGEAGEGERWREGRKRGGRENIVIYIPEKQTKNLQIKRL